MPQVKQRTGMIIVVVVVVVVVLFACVTLQRKKELICELKKKKKKKKKNANRSGRVSLFILVLQEQRVYTSRAILFYSGLRSSAFVSPTRWERTVVVEEALYTLGVVVLVRPAYCPRVPRRFGGFV